MVPFIRVLAISILLVALGAFGLAAQQPAPVEPAPAEKQILEIKLGYLRAYEPQLALSVMDIPPRDEGVAGGQVAIGDNNTTGKFLGQEFTLAVTEVKFGADVVPAFEELVSKGVRYILTDLAAEQLLSIADLARDKGILIINVGATDDHMREADCRANVFHTIPTRSMLRSEEHTSELQSIMRISYAVFGLKKKKK